MSKIVFTDLARADLLETWEYVAARRLSAADRLLLTINDDIHTLAKQPLMGRERPELRVGLRSWPTPRIAPPATRPPLNRLMGPRTDLAY
jgi:toxin ParE1/3/4